MPVQTSYADIDKAFAGQLADINPREVVSKVAEGAIEYGYPVVRGTSENQGKIPTGTGQAFLGVNVYTLGGYSSADDISKVNDEEIASVIRTGYVWVTAEVNVSAGDSVFFVHTGNVGQYRNDGTNADAITGATFETDATAGQVALIRLP